MEDEVFVTYSWGTEDENRQVYGLVELLRIEGFKAECDIMKMQEQTATNFKEMMHKGLSYKKVIVVLSEGYKKKADEFAGGVGTEYRTILSDIQENKNKYIFVSFNKVTEEYANKILPLMLKGTQILDLSKGESVINELKAKLLDKDLYIFSPVSDKAKDIEQIRVQPISFKHSTEDSISNEKEYITEAKSKFKKLNIEITNTECKEMNGTNLYSGIAELEDGRVVAFPCKDFDIVDNNIWYYYNVKNGVIYKYENEKFSKIK